jgi:hypothetical protein
MTDRLSIYNGALRKLKERELASLTENREPRRLLDSVWDSGAIEACLEAGQWSFATRRLALFSSPSVSPQFGFQYAFELPEDYIRLVGISRSAGYHEPMNRYEFSGGFVFSSLEPMYIAYVSGDDLFGRDFSLWPQSFVNFVEWHFAAEIAPKLTASEQLIERVNKDREKAKQEAMSLDSQRGPSKQLPHGSWTRARHSRAFQRNW